jgi:hypothetical protein
VSEKCHPYGTDAGATSVDFCEFCPRWHFNTTPGATQVQDCVYDHAGARGGVAGLVLAALVVAILTLLTVSP